MVSEYPRRWGGSWLWVLSAGRCRGVFCRTYPHPPYHSHRLPSASPAVAPAWQSPVGRMHLGVRVGPGAPWLFLTPLALVCPLCPWWRAGPRHTLPQLLVACTVELTALVWVHWARAPPHVPQTRPAPGRQRWRLPEQRGRPCTPARPVSCLGRLPFPAAALVWVLWVLGVLGRLLGRAAGGWGPYRSPLCVPRTLWRPCSAWVRWTL